VEPLPDRSGQFFRVGTGNAERAKDGLLYLLGGFVYVPPNVVVLLFDTPERSGDVEQFGVGSFKGGVGCRIGPQIPILPFRGIIRA
jgi:hypothetical protein